MKLALTLLTSAALALGGSIAVSATVMDEPSVNDAAVMEGIPRSLSQFGFFRDLPAQDPNARVVDYQLLTPLYSDGTDKLRFIYVPEGAFLDGEGDGLLHFPVGSAIIKTFAFGEGEDRDLIETRVLLKRIDGWLALPYRWNEDQTDAKLALAGARIPIIRPDGEQISYRIPNKNQCKTCHSKDGEVIPIGPKARNLSGLWTGAVYDADMLQSFPEVTRYLPAWNSRSLVPDTDALARAYLDVNCAHCHQPGGSASNSGLDLRWEQDDPHAIGIRKPPVAAGRGSGGRRVAISPGDPDKSFLVYRMNSTEAGIAMPELGRSTVDPEGMEVIRKWIAQMPAHNASETPAP